MSLDDTSDSESTPSSTKNNTTAPQDIQQSIDTIITQSNEEPLHIPTTKSTMAADSTLLARARKARYDSLQNFSGQQSEDAERFLKSIKNISKATDDSTDPLLLEIVRGKLTQTAGLWFDDNESKFTKWSDFETAFRNRYFSTTIINQKFDKLSQRKQQYDESVTSYFDDIITLCREVDQQMPDTVIIQHLMKGINPEFRKELTRRQTTITTLSEFLKLAKVEQDLHDTFTQLQEMTIQPEPYATYHLSTQRNRMAPRNNWTYGQQQHAPRNQNFRTAPTQNSDENRNSPMNDTQGNARHQPTFDNNTRTTSERTRQTRYRSCKVCGKQNHRSIDCIHKQKSGCYNCGKQHSVRDCVDPPHFQ